MKKVDLRQSYRDFVQSVKRQYEPDQAMQLAIGAEFDAFGVIERDLLIQYGLQPDDYVIDIGCGSGRLAKPLSQYLRGRYLGTDIVPDLVDYARALVNRPDWRFEVAEGLTIPEQDEQANMVCFFSVLTHLLHEHSFIYLREARRVLKPGGKIIFSFLDFTIPCHWDVFEANLASGSADHPLNTFISRDAIEVWCRHLDLEIEALHDGDAPHIPLQHPVTLDSGQVMEGMGNLGQSVCVLVKR